MPVIYSDGFFQNQTHIAAHFQELIINEDDEILPEAELYKGVATILSKYTVGSKFPDAFEQILSMQNWEEVLSITEPDNWSPYAVYQATRIFVHNFGATKVECFYRLVLLPRVRNDIRQNNHLHIALYRSLQKALQKPTAFCKGILIPLCESRTCTPREEVIVGSIIEKKSFPLLHLCVTLFKLSGMVYCGTISYFIKLLLEKVYNLPYQVLNALVAHFMRFVNKTRITPVIWHQSLLRFVQRYKNELLKEDKDSLKFLLEKQTHELVTPEISRELNHSYNRDEKLAFLKSIPCDSGYVLGEETYEEDTLYISDFPNRFDISDFPNRFDISDFPMEEDILRL